MAVELVTTQAPEKVTSRTRPATEVPKLVIVAVPVTVTASASEVPRSVVDALAMLAELSAFVERTMACTARR